MKINFKERCKALEASGMSKADAYKQAKIDDRIARKGDNVLKPRRSDAGCQACWMPLAMCKCNK